jgi:phage terminase small subunit
MVDASDQKPKRKPYDRRCLVQASRRLTAKQEAFCQEYIKNGRNATAAFRHAFDVAPTTNNNVVGVNACRLLSNTKIELRLQQLQQAITDQALAKYQVTQDRIIGEYARVAFSNGKKLFRKTDDGSIVVVNPADLSDDDAAGITVGYDSTGIKVSFKASDKLNALQILARTQGMLVDKTNNTNINISVADMTDEELDAAIEETEQ